jgi:hypothetical protein
VKPTLPAPMMAILKLLMLSPSMGWIIVGSVKSVGGANQRRFVLAWVILC